MLLLGFDFETTGPEPEECQITEAAFVLMDAGSKRIVRALSYFLKCSEEITLEITKLTKITPETHSDYAVDGALLASDMKERLCLADGIAARPILVGHNSKKFDRILLRRFAETHQLGSLFEGLDHIDTMTDIEHDSDSRKLGYLAADYGFINPFPHCAIGDVMTTLQILTRHDVHQALANSREKTVKLYASVSFERKDLAKSAGYQWVPERKVWAKEVRESQVAKTIAEAEGKFPVRQLPM